MTAFKVYTDCRGGKTIRGPGGFAWAIPSSYPDGAAEDIARNMTSACSTCASQRNDDAPEDLRIRERP